MKALGFVVDKKFPPGYCQTCGFLERIHKGDCIYHGHTAKGADKRFIRESREANRHIQHYLKSERKSPRIVNAAVTRAFWVARNSTPEESYWEHLMDIDWTKDRNSIIQEIIRCGVGVVTKGD